MASNFDFLEKIDRELYEIIIDSEKLFRDGYFNQSVVQLRIFGEKIAKKVLEDKNPDLTFDDVLHCLKDRIKDGVEGERQKEFVDDLFFIKQEGNKCAHGEEADGLIALEAIKRAFEASINYVWMIKKDDKIDKIDRLAFDETLLVTQKEARDTKLVDKYLELAKQNIEKEKELEKKLNDKEIEKETKKRVKDRVREAKKTRKGFDKTQKEKTSSKIVSDKTSKKDKKPYKKTSSKKDTKMSKKKQNNDFNFDGFKILFWAFVLFSLLVLLKIIFFCM